jgi:polysaccharide pyruvyl transferase WcaK-like protein
MGYNGANNTGSEARLLAIIEDIRAVLGKNVDITVPTLNPVNLRRYLNEGPHLRIAPFPTIFHLALRRMVKEQDIVLLVEGSCYMDYWSSALLWAFLWVSKCAYKFNKPNLAYAVDSGPLSQKNQNKVHNIASKTDLIIARTEATKEHLKGIGVAAPFEVTADTAFTFKMETKDNGILKKIWSDAKNGVVGLSVLDFYLWPVVIRLWGKKEHCYRWPYYFSRGTEKCKASDDLVNKWAEEADRIIEKYDKSIALICMEQLDEPIANEIYKKMKYSNRARIFSSRDYNASQMTGILRGLDLLVTSRYHGSVLSLAKQIPQIAFGQDTRLRRLYKDLKLYDDYFIEENSTNRWERLGDNVDKLLTNTTLQKEKLKVGFQEHLARAKRNRVLLKDFVTKYWYS